MKNAESNIQTLHLALERIRTDGGTQPRAALNDDVITEYAEAMAEGAEFPPVDVFYDGTDYWLADGFHRAAAARKAGLEDIEARVHQGTVRDAVLFSVGVNAAHGLRRTNEDKRRAVLRLLTDPEWSQWNDREIARRCNVSHQFVSNLRHELSVNGLQIASDKRLVQRGGTVYEQRVSSEKRSQSKPMPDYSRVDEYQGEITALLANSPLDYQTIRTRLGIRQDDRASLSALRVAMDRLLGMGAVRKEHGAYHLVDPNPRVQVKDVYEQQRQRAASRPALRYVADPEFDQRVADDDEEYAAPASPHPLLPTADRIRDAIVAVLRENATPLSITHLHSRVEKHLASRVHLPTLSSIVSRLESEGVLQRDPQTLAYGLTQPAASPARPVATGNVAGEPSGQAEDAPLTDAILAALSGGPLTHQQTWRAVSQQLSHEIDAGVFARAMDELVKAKRIQHVAGARYALSGQPTPGETPTDTQAAAVPDRATILQRDRAQAAEAEARNAAAWLAAGDRGTLERALYDLIDACGRALRIRGIRAWAGTFTPDELRADLLLIDNALSDVRLIDRHLRDLRAKLDIMIQTGKPYDDVEEHA